MKIIIRFMFYNAYGVGGIGRTSFNFANYLYGTGKYDVEIISIRRTSDDTTFYLNPKIRITVIQDARRGIQYDQEDLELMAKPSQLINPAEDQYPMFNAYTDKRMYEILKSMRGGVLITTMTSLNALSADYVDDSVLKIGQMHSELIHFPPELQKLTREKALKLDALTILLESERQTYIHATQGKVPIYVLPNGTSLPKFRANLKNHVIVAAGRYVEVKGYDKLIRAFAMIAEQYPDWVVKIYGWGDAVNYLQTIKECGVEGQVVLEPPTNKMMEKFSEASFLVCSSDHEGISMTILEALSLGLPCVCFMCPGNTEIITDEFDGLLVPKGDLKGLAQAMSKLMGNEEYRWQLGENAYITRKKFDVKQIGANLENIIIAEMERKFGKDVTNDSPTKSVNKTKRDWGNDDLKLLEKKAIELDKIKKSRGFKALKKYYKVRDFIFSFGVKKNN